MKNEYLKLSIIRAASKALDYRKCNPRLKANEILQQILNEFEEKEAVKIVCIAAVTQALKYQDSGIWDDRKILQNIVKESDEILSSVGIE